VSTGIGPVGVDDVWLQEYAARTQAARDHLCTAGQHYYRRVMDMWTCENCLSLAPLRPPATGSGKAAP
jgi:hypothetical protein